MTFEAARHGDFDTALVRAGEAADLIARVEDAAARVEWIGQGAESQLRAAPQSVRPAWSDTVRVPPRKPERHSVLQRARRRPGVRADLVTQQQQHARPRDLVPARVRER